MQFEKSIVKYNLRNKNINISLFLKKISTYDGFFFEISIINNQLRQLLIHFKKEEQKYVLKKYLFNILETHHFLIKNKLSSRDHFIFYLALLKLIFSFLKKSHQMRDAIFIFEGMKNDDFFLIVQKEIQNSHLYMENN